MDNNTLYNNSEGYKHFLKAYKTQIDEGWKFYSNDVSSPETLNKKLGALQINGLEVLLGDLAFKADGTIMPKGRVILVRKKS